MLSFVPVLGVLVGAISIGYGDLRKPRSWALVAIGTAGIVVTVSIYALLFRSIKSKTGVFANLQQQMQTTHILPNIVRSVEFYRSQHGTYPEKLTDLPPLENWSSQDNIYVPATGSVVYQLSADKKTYELFSTGPDEKPNTADDLYPNLDPAQGTIGYRK